MVLYKNNIRDDTPMISIIIPIYNQHSMTEQCIESIKANTEDYELIIVDNGSYPAITTSYGFPAIERDEKFGQVSILPGDPACLTIRNKENLGFSVAVNQGIRASHGDIICLLNNDTVVTPGWADGLKRRLDEYSIVGPMTNYVAGAQKAITTTYDDNAGLNYAAKEWSGSHQGATQEVNFVIGFCMMFPRALYNEIGEFDESMWPCSGEEIDFCFKARKAGHRVGIAKDVYIHHYGSQTFEDMQAAGTLDYKDTCNKCNTHLAEKWGDGFWQRQEHVQVESDIRLNLGCGACGLKNFINIDQFENVKPDMVCDAMSLPYDPGTISEIYCGHMLEHMTLKDGKKALRYWKSLLIPGGKITITVPDFDYCIKKYLKNPTSKALIELNDEIIYSYCQKSHHKYCYSGALLKEIMARVGFVGLNKLPIDHEYFVDPVLWQVAYTGRKA